MMRQLLSYAAALADAPAAKRPPIDDWRPDKVVDIDLAIRDDGVWTHEGAVIERARLVRLFASLLRREGADYFLVTPHEKYPVLVEDAPFLAILLETGEIDGERTIDFILNTGERVEAGPGAPLLMRPSADDNQCALYLRWRGDLEARIARAAYYDLVSLGERRTINGEAVFGVASRGAFFTFMSAHDIDKE